MDALFLDIQMPVLNGFDLLARLPTQPNVVFTTAHDQYALRAFEVSSIDYLLKPVERAALERALGKLERLTGGAAWAPLDPGLLHDLAASLHAAQRRYPDRIASRLGTRVQLVELERVTHFFARDKLTFAASEGRSYVVDESIAELEQKLDPARFLRVHRAVLVNLSHVQEVDASVSGRVCLRLKGAARTELPVARDRVRALRDRLGF